MPHVLIVDDDSLVLETLTSIMESASFTTATAADGRQALLQCNIRVPDLVIIDMIMPEMEGLETIKQLRQQFPATKIIAISGGGSLKPRDYLDVARKLGADFSLMKPCGRDELITASRNLLSV